MPRRKSNKNNLQSLVPFYASKSYVNLLYGGLTVILLFIVVFFVLKIVGHRAGKISDEAARTTAEQTSSIYVVTEGDSLWSIAQDKYNNGYA